MIFLNKNLMAIDFISLRDYTIENSKLLKISKLDIDIAKSQLEYIDSEKYPSITIGISNERSKGLNDDSTTSSYVGDNSVSSSTLYKTYSYLSLNYSLYDFGRLKYKKENQKYDIETKKNKFCMEQNNILEKLLDSYYNTKISQIKKQYLEQILKYSNELYNYYKRLHEIGNIQKIEVVSNAIEVANLYTNISQNEKNLVENFENLSSISTYNFKSSDQLESLYTPKDIKEFKFENTNIAKSYENEIRKKRAELSLIQAEYYPRINAFGKYDFYGYDKDGFRSAYDNLEENSYKYGINISWSVFDGFKVKSQEKKATQELAQLKLKYEQAKADFFTQLNSLNKTYKFYSKIIEKNAQTTNLSNENVDMSLKLNKIGEVDKSMELNSIIKKLNAESEYKQAQETIAYKMLKKEIITNGDSLCTVH